MKRRGFEVISHPRHPDDVWIGSAYGCNIELFVREWLQGLTSGLAYRYTENGITTYMPVDEGDR